MYFAIDCFVLKNPDMNTTVSSRWQTVIPTPIRERYSIKAGDTLVWLDDGKTIRVVSAPSNRMAAIKKLRGHAKGRGLTTTLLAARAEYRSRELNNSKHG